MNKSFFSLEIKSYYRQFMAAGRQLFLRLLTLSLCLVLLSSCQNSSPDSQVIHLTLWQGINPPVSRDVFERLVAKFNRTHSDVQVDSIFAGDIGQQLPKIFTSVVGNVPPDILFYFPQLTGQLLELNAVVPLQDWWDKSPLKDEIFPNLLDELKLDGQLWSIPLYTSNIGILYRADLFKAAGITQPPKTWQELREVAKKLTLDKNGDGRTDQYGILLPLGKGEWTIFSWFPFLLNAGGEIVTNNQPNLTNPGAINALKFWENLLKDGSATLSPPERGYEEDAFFAGRVAMQITGPWSYITKSQVDFGVFPIPGDVNYATVTGTGNLYVMKTTPEREKAALKFLEFVLSEEFQTEWAIGTDFLPVNIKSTQSPAYQEYLKQKPWLKVFIEQLPRAKYRPVVARYSRISESLGRAIESTLLGKSTTEEALKSAQQRLELIWNRE